MTASQQLISVTPGRDLVEALNEACAGLEGWVQAVGTLETIELRVAGEGIHPRRALSGRWSLVSLSGATGGPYAVTLARATKTGIEVVGGELLSGRCEGVVAFMTSSGVAATRMAPEPEPVNASAPSRAAAPQASSSWASAALETAAQIREAEEPDDEPELPGPGDLVQHFAFGLCEVLMGDDERLKIRDLKGPGRIREIRLEMLVVGAPSEKDGKRLFRLDRRN